MDPYDLHSWSTQYRQERLAEVGRRRLIQRAKGGRERRSGWARMSLAWASVLSLLSEAGL